MVEHGVIRPDYTENKLNEKLSARLDQGEIPSGHVIIPYGRYEKIWFLGIIDDVPYIAVKADADSAMQSGICTVSGLLHDEQSRMILSVDIAEVEQQIGKTLVVQTKTGWVLVDLLNKKVKTLNDLDVRRRDQVTLSADEAYLSIFRKGGSAKDADGHAVLSADGKSDDLGRLLNLQGEVLYETDRRITMTDVAEIAVIGEKPIMMRMNQQSGADGILYRLILSEEAPQQFVNIKTGETLFTLPEGHFYIDTVGPYLQICSVIQQEATAWSYLYTYLLDAQGNLAFDGQIFKQISREKGRFIGEIYDGCRIDTPEARITQPLEKTMVQVYDGTESPVYTAEEGELLAKTDGETLCLLTPEGNFRYVQFDEQGQASVRWQAQDALCAMDFADGTALIQMLPRDEKSPRAWQSALTDAWLHRMISSGDYTYRYGYALAGEEGLQTVIEPGFDEASLSLNGYAVVTEENEYAMIDLNNRGVKE